MMKIFQQQIKINNKRGFHLITTKITQAMPEINKITNGICQVFIQHTSASQTLNENADPTVRKDFETWFNKSVPENFREFEHKDEGADDMPAHLKLLYWGIR